MKFDFSLICKTIAKNFEDNIVAKIGEVLNSNFEGFKNSEKKH